MSSTKSNTLHVPGAQLAYEICGSGPVLLLIHGGGGDARAFNSVAKHLASQYTVVTYDRRGLSRSTLDDPEEEQQVEMHSDDAYHLLVAISSEPVYVFGSSGGAVVGLDLVARYPDQVRALIAHEPPSHLLPGLEERHDTIREISQREGATSAMQQFMAQIGVTYDDREPDADLPEQGERPIENTMFLLKREFAMYDRYRFDFAALKSASTQTRIVIAAGQSGREYVGYQNAVAMADKLGTTVMEFPGHHVGYISHPRAFAARLQEVLGETPLP
jgi:pimeloyl-ACP methyl ester carboxylesterase